MTKFRYRDEHGGAVSRLGGGLALGSFLQNSIDKVHTSPAPRFQAVWRSTATGVSANVEVGEGTDEDVP